MIRDLPPPLPPETRTVGQLVAESIRVYGQSFWSCIPLGLPFAVADQLGVDQGWRVQLFVYLALTPIFVAAYVRACTLVLDGRPTRTAVLVAVLIWLPFPVLRLGLLPALAWLAFIGLAVPAAMVESTGFRESLIRGRRLALAGYAHALGSLCTLVIVVGISSQVLGSLLQSESAAALRVALFLSDLVLSPLLYLGSAMLYLDQAARLRVRDGRLHPPVEPDPARRADAQIES